ncbi:MAG: methionyl-tRNA formyltransferase [Desulfobacteraceae bacterium]|nr:methionyl-tRNA formyltransferase [Desulfobacteraceae bacterium]
MTHTHKTRIVFMGTPDFAVPPLQALAARPDVTICLVVTQPDRPKGRGRKLTGPPVKKAAMALGLDIFQPEKLNTDAAADLLTSLAPDYFVVAAFGQILSRRILDIPIIYPVNIHASLLPRYRGAAPIQAAIRNMDKTCGVTTMVMAKGLDTGDILLKAATPIHPDETAQELHDRLSAMGADLILDTIDQITNHRLTPIPQDHENASYAPMLKKEDGRIDWTLSNREVVAHINAMNPWPGAFTHMSGTRLKIFTAVPGENATGSTPGTVCGLDSQGIHVAAGSGTVIILELMGASGKRLFADAFLRGHPMDLSARFA